MPVRSSKCNCLTRRQITSFSSRIQENKVQNDLLMYECRVYYRTTRLRAGTRSATRSLIVITKVTLAINRRLILVTAGSRQLCAMQNQCRIHWKTSKFCPDSNDILHSGKFFNCTGNNKKWSCQVQNVSQNSNHPLYGTLQNPCRMWLQNHQILCSAKFDFLSTFCHNFPGCRMKWFCDTFCIPSTLGKIIGFQQWVYTTPYFLTSSARGVTPPLRVRRAKPFIYPIGSLISCLTLPCFFHIIAWRYTA